MHNTSSFTSFPLPFGVFLHASAVYFHSNQFHVNPACTYLDATDVFSSFITIFFIGLSSFDSVISFDFALTSSSSGATSICIKSFGFPTNGCRPGTALTRQEWEQEFQPPICQCTTTDQAATYCRRLAQLICQCTTTTTD